MATLLLSAAGATIGSGIGGSILGLSGAVVGRAIGATVGQSIDQRVLGSQPAQSSQGRIDRFHLSGAGYGSPIKQVWGRARIAGEIIWASQFLETRTASQGSKGTRRPSSEAFSYTVSIAIALCEGEALTVGRVWADGTEIAMNSIDMRFYPGSDDQLPDPKIEAVEGIGFAPTYRGICYVVIENLAIARFGNRVPQFSFEVIRRAKKSQVEDYSDLPSCIRAVAMIPGTGEYALATTPVHISLGIGVNASTNVHSIQGITDFSNSLIQLGNELPECQSVSLVVSWFGNDLRCGECQIQPKVEQIAVDGVEIPWVVSGVTRENAKVIPTIDGKSVFGGTPTDKSIIEAIAAIRSSGKEVMFYPFILMDQLSGNTLPNPWATSTFQPALPWRGRITLNAAPGVGGTTDQTEESIVELSKFLGSAGIQDFSLGTYTVEYTGPSEWSYRRFILHYAHLCLLAGGVEAFCIGSEMRGLTTVRSSTSTFPMVTALKQLAAEVKEILGPDTNVTYAADWSEYFGYHLGQDIFFHLDPLWADPNIDFIGIDNYMPVSDWRENENHADSHWKSIYNIEYLVSNVMGGEGYDWYYDSPENAASQRRIRIRDEAYSEDWVYRFKDLHSWWANDHHNRFNGVRSEIATDWIPQSKRITFTEYGCAAVDRGSNQPNHFVDPKSSESLLPRDSNGGRDDLLQMRYFQAVSLYWRNEINNPISLLYDGRMVDFDHCHAWAWDARPFPEFPSSLQLWEDAENYDRGHWLNGRSSNQLFSSVAHELFNSSNVLAEMDATRAFGVIRGYVTDSSVLAREKIDRLVSLHGLNFREKEGICEIASDCVLERSLVSIDNFVALGAGNHPDINQRDTGASLIGRLRLSFVGSEGDHEVQIVEAFFDDISSVVMQIEIALLVTRQEAIAYAENLLLSENWSLQSRKFVISKASTDLYVGGIIDIDDQKLKITEISETDVISVEAVNLAGRASAADFSIESNSVRKSFFANTPPFVTLLDLPILGDDLGSLAPYVAAYSTPWPSSVSVWSSSSSTGFELNTVISVPSIIGRSSSEMAFAPPDVWDRGTVLRVNLASGSLSSSDPTDVLNGANLMAIGDPNLNNWEVFQFSRVEVIAPGVFDLSVLVRGLHGSDSVIPLVWPIGSLVVLIDGFLQRVSFQSSLIGLERNFRVGASEFGAFDHNVVPFSHEFLGIALRPYSVSHLDAQRSLSGDIVVQWIRRTRLDGDRWQFVDVPLGEDVEQFVLTVYSSGSVIRQVFVSESFFTYTMEMQVYDGVFGLLVFEVSQVSSSFGPGPGSSIYFV